MHGLTNRYLYVAKMIIAQWSDGQNTVELRGTGFFVEKDGDIFLITNRHVVEPGYSDQHFANYKIVNLFVYSYQSFDANDLPQSLHIAEIANFGEFVYPENYYNDVACLKNAQLKNGDVTIICDIKYDMIADDPWINTRTSICDEIAYPGFPEWYDRQNNTPILRKGTIASDPRLNYSYEPDAPIASRIAYEGFSSGGASGSPVFLLQKGFKLGEGLAYSGSDDFFREVKLIGINAGHFSDQRGHSGISFFYKSSVIRELIES